MSMLNNMKLIHQRLLDEAADTGIGKGVCQGVWDQSPVGSRSKAPTRSLGHSPQKLIMCKLYYNDVSAILVTETKTRTKIVH